MSTTEAERAQNAKIYNHVCELFAYDWNAAMQLDRHPDPAVRRCVAERFQSKAGPNGSNCGPWVGLAPGSNSTEYHRRVNTDAPALIARLAADPDVTVRRAVARSHALSNTICAGAVEALAKDPDAEVRAVLAWSLDRTIYPKAWATLARDSDRTVRYWVAGREPELDYWESLAGNPPDEEIVTRLLGCFCPEEEKGAPTEAGARLLAEAGSVRAAEWCVWARRWTDPPGVERPRWIPYFV